MTIQINNLGELQKFLDNTSIEITTVEEIRELFRSINQDVTPEIRQEELAFQERQQERQLAHEAKMRNLEHLERMKALEMGHFPVDPTTAKEMARVASKAAATAGWIGILVPFGLFGAAVGTTYFLFEKLDISPASIALMGIVWGTAALVSLLAVVLSLGTVRRKGTLSRDSLHSLEKNKPNSYGQSPQEPKEPSKENIVETGAYSA